MNLLKPEQHQGKFRHLPQSAMFLICLLALTMAYLLLPHLFFLFFFPLKKLTGCIDMPNLISHKLSLTTEDIFKYELCSSSSST